MFNDDGEVTLPRKPAYDANAGTSALSILDSLTMSHALKGQGDSPWQMRVHLLPVPLCL